MASNNLIYSTFLHLKDLPAWDPTNQPEPFTFYYITNFTSHINSIVADQQGNFYVLANEYGLFPWTPSVRIMKFDSSGKLLKSYKISDFANGRGLAIDQKGDIYITGLIQITNFSRLSGAIPITKNAVQKRPLGTGTHAFVLKIEGATFETNPTVTYGSYLSGSSAFDVGNAIAVDNSGNIWITGSTSSPDFFKNIGNSYQKEIATGQGAYTLDAFLIKIKIESPEKSEVVYSTFIGGQLADQGFAISVDDQENVYVTGIVDFPLVIDAQNLEEVKRLNQDKLKVTENAYQKHFGGGDYAGFIAKFTKDGDVVYCSYLGGKIADQGTAIACDHLGNAYVAGITAGNFLVTDGAFKPDFPGGAQSIFVTKISRDGFPIYSTYLGGTGNDEVKSIQLDINNHLNLVGTTTSCDFDVTDGAFETKYFAGNGDGFLAKLNPDGNQLIYSTYIGGTKRDSCESLYLDNNGVAYISGVTGSTDFVVTEDAAFPEFPVKKDEEGEEVEEGMAGFVMKLSTEAEAEKEITMDVKLQEAINSILGREANHKITNYDLAKLPIELDLSSIDIENLSGLEYATYVRSLNISNNKIKTLRPLANLTRLQYLDVSRNQLTNIDDLEKLKNLKQLYLNENNISNINVLINMPKLMDLEMNHNLIRDISVLKHLKLLRKVDLSSNQVVDLTPLQSLKHLSKVNFSDQKITLEPLEKFVNDPAELSLNFLLNIAGKTPIPFAISDNGVYQQTNNKIIWTGITSDKDVTFRFDDVTSDFSGKYNFSGLITIPIKII